jgi:CRISPR system Cascade subunit CasE
MTLHMIKLTPDFTRLTRWAEREGLQLKQQQDDLGYTLHAALKNAFGDFAPRPFALQQHRSSIDLLGYTAHTVDDLRLHAQSFADPEVAEALGLQNLAGKVMPERFSAGQRLGFSVRIRPTIRTDRNGARNQVVERDAFRDPKDGGADDSRSRGDVYQQWLHDRLSRGGAQAEHLVLDRYCRSITLRRNAARQLKAVDGPDATFSGVLEVIDPASFATLLAGGVGRHAAFGFGMLLLKPA